MNHDQVKILKRNVSIEEVERVLLKISEGPLLKSDYRFFLLCSECNRTIFYKKLMAEFGVWVRFFPTGSIAKKIASYVFGTPAIIILKDSSKIRDVFLKISEQAMAVIYVYADSNSSNMIDLVLENPNKIDEVVMANGNYFKYLVDEDSSQSGDDIIEIVELGNLFPRKFVEYLGILEE